MSISSSIFPLVLLLALLPLTLSRSLPSTVSRQRSVGRCGGACRFRLCTPGFGGPRFTSTVNPAADFLTFISPNEDAAPPFICTPRRRNTFGRVLAVAEPRVRVGGAFVSLSNFSPEGLDAPFASDAITVGDIAGRQMSGITVGNVTAAQFRLLNQRCLTMGIRRFQVIDFDTREPIRTMGVRPRPRNCVAFRTRTPRIVVDFSWDTPDDFDLSVTEPDGDQVFLGSGANPTDGGGVFGGDMNVGTCNDRTVTSGTEFATYSDFIDGSTVEEGEYQVVASHFNRCRDVDTNWILTVTIDGVVSLTMTGVATMGNGEIVVDTTFTFP